MEKLQMVMAYTQKIGLLLVLALAVVACQKSPVAAPNTANLPVAAEALPPATVAAANLPILAISNFLLGKWGYSLPCEPEIYEFSDKYIINNYDVDGNSPSIRFNNISYKFSDGTVAVDFGALHGIGGVPNDKELVFHSKGNDAAYVVLSLGDLLQFVRCK